ncbi:2-keto-4-pentenoate hydratase [Methylobacterium isbiliense]|jgi:2-keto-4-pentenoate hydratase|uniref:2-keto-4-pentenoate hydratase n=1 Tax=Methylobacterium isbiliense TaxID=315478 RepID=A0ABQ4SKZ8_9HYPH|nr:fumarylacetoacetate hydrolase family protein [Methylobacterium isbiliense]MDN3625115.1 fumarylacetoacetate hydrolase family protein [Methylobacterium isbiliense]GJE03855.1 2-keto-4-pentenoate hydratase [Methylobacterium isbiliense]
MSGFTEAAAAAASDRLWRHWQEGTRLDALPPDERPATRAEGYAIQARLEARSRAPLVGWKIAATSAAGQAHIGVDGPLAGRLLAERVLEPGAEIPYRHNLMRVAEAEIAFRIGRDLSPRGAPYDEAGMRAAVDGLHPAIEFPDSRFADFATAGGPQLIADNACTHWFVLGPAVAAWRDLDLANLATVARVEGQPEHHGRGANVLGDPWTALTWLVNEVTGLGLTLRAGEIVTTGTTTVPVPLRPDSRMSADLGPLGTVTARIGPA